METAGRQIDIRLALVFIAVFFAFPIIWLVASWVKYVYFVYAIIVIIILFLTISNYDFNNETKLNSSKGFEQWFNILLILIPTVLLLLIQLPYQSELLVAPLTLIVTTAIPGYTLLRLTGLRKYFSKLEVFVFSIIISYIFTGFLWFGLILIELNLRIHIFLFLCIGLCVGSYLFGKNETQEETRYSSFCRPIDVYVLILAVLFYALSFLIIYPGFALLPGTDIARHYMWSIILGRSPEMYPKFQYLFFHLFESAFLYISGAHLVPAQVTLLTLNLVLPLGLYVGTKRLFGHINNKIPALTALVWVLFTGNFGGFAWIYFAILKLIRPELTQFQLISITNVHTYNGLIYGIFGLWFVPLAMSVLMLFSLFALLGNDSLPRIPFYVLATAILASMFLTHVVEATIFALFISVYVIIVTNRVPRSDYFIEAGIFAYLIVIGVYAILSGLLLRFDFSFTFLVVILVPFTALSFSFILNKIIRPHLPYAIQRLRTSQASMKSFAWIMFAIITFLYILAVVSSIVLAPNFQTNQVDFIGLVPWFMYPIMLGIYVPLALIAVYFILKTDWNKRIFLFFVLLLGFAFLTGRVISFFNIAIIQTGYWEKRFVDFMKIPLSIFAAMGLVVAADKIQFKMSNNWKKPVTGLCLVGLIVLLGFTTSVLNIEYWNDVASNPNNLPSDPEMEALASLAGIYHYDQRAWFATVTGRSNAMGTFSAPVDWLELRQLLYTAKKPEFALFQLYRHPIYSHPYIYLHERDWTVLSQHEGNFLSQYLPSIPVVFNNTEVTIFNSSALVFPKVRSDLVLISPFDNFLTSNQILTGYYVLAGNGREFTTAYDLDESIFDSNIFMLNYDPPNNSLLLQEYGLASGQLTHGLDTVFGRWIIENSTLIANSSIYSRNGLLLTPGSLTDISSSFQIELVNMNASEANTIALVFSYQDSFNYKTVELIFHPNGYIYTLFRNVTGTDWENGVAYPLWPGNNTGIEWEVNGSYDIDFSINAFSANVRINNTDYLNLELSNDFGKAGLFYTRFNEVAFHNFSLNGYKLLGLRNASDYLSFVNQGGELIVLNTNGYHTFGKQLFDIENTTILCNQIKGANYNITLGTDIPVDVITINNTDSEIIANYASVNQSSPFILAQNYGFGKIYYVNLFPILRAIQLGMIKTPPILILDKILNFLELPSFVYEEIEVDGFVKAIEFQNFLLLTNSVLVDPNVIIPVLQVQNQHGLTEYFNVSNFQLNCQSLSLRSSSGKMDLGTGFYSRIESNRTVSVIPLNQDGVLKFSSNGSHFEIDTIHSIVFPTQESKLFFVRAPRITTQNCIFKEIYSYGSLYLFSGAYGQDLHIYGSANFSIVVSDTYSMISGIEILGSYQLSPQLVLYDALSTIPVAIGFSLIIIPLLIGFSVYRRRKW